MLRNQGRIIEICKTSGRTNYINQIGEAELYDKEEFLKEGIKLKFIETESFEYVQFDHTFVPKLSTIEIIIFNLKDKLKKLLVYYPTL